MTKVFNWKLAGAMLLSAGALTVTALFWDWIKYNLLWSGILATDISKLIIYILWTVFVWFASKLSDRRNATIYVDAHREKLLQQIRNLTDELQDERKARKAAERLADDRKVELEQIAAISSRAKELDRE